MVPSPGSLGLRWTIGSTGDESVLPLDFLHNLHIKTTTVAAAK